MKRKALYVDEELHSQLKNMAARRGVFLQQESDEALQYYINNLANFRRLETDGIGREAASNPPLPSRGRAKASNQKDNKQ